MYRDGFIECDGANLSVPPLGQVFARNVAMMFDAYLETSSFKQFYRTV